MIPDYIWLVSALIIGFLIPAVFTGWLKLPRNLYLLIYIPVVLAFFSFFIIKTNLPVFKLMAYNWYWGLLGAGFATAMVLNNVLSQPSSESQKGIWLAWDITWPGFLYGLTDALFLSVFPVLAVGEVFSDAAWAEGWFGRIGLGFLALVASLIITGVYHLGYPEFRNRSVFWTMLGNGIMTLAYVVTLSPLAAILPHIAMHITAMVHGRETTGQVPPHYHHETVNS